MLSFWGGVLGIGTGGFKKVSMSPIVCDVSTGPLERRSYYCCVFMGDRDGWGAKVTDLRSIVLLLCGERSGEVFTWTAVVRFGG